MQFRDRVVVVVLVLSAVLACLLWHPVGRWAALAVVVVGVLIAATVYRLRPPAFGLNEEIRVPGVRQRDGSLPDVERRAVVQSAPPVGAGPPIA